jgi:hypothetical protein
MGEEMTAYHDTLTLDANTWKALTSGTITAGRFTNLSGAPVWLQATAANTAPTSRVGAVPLQPGLSIAADLTLAQMFPGVTSAAYLWGYCEMGGSMSVSHA